jgi:transcriptional regulator GlxA family with amidase domain
MKKYIAENEKTKPKKFKSKEENNENSESKNALFDSLVVYYENEKPYLDSKLKADVVAKKMGVTQREISNLLKINGFTSFNNFNNKFRVEDVKKCFDDINYKKIKTEVIANHCGFGSKQPFYYAFEEFTWLNPGFYRSEMSK